MGAPRATREAQMAYLLSIQQAYKEQVDCSLNGNYQIGTPNDHPSKLRLHVRNLDKTFNQEMLCGGLKYQFRSPEEDQHTFRGISDQQELKQKMLKEGGTYAWILKTCELLTGPEPPLDLPTRIKRVLFEEQTSSWEGIALKHVERVIDTIDRFNESLYEDVCPNTDVRQHLRGNLYDAEIGAEKRAKEELAQLLKDQKQRLHTNDPRLEMQRAHVTQLRILHELNFVSNRKDSSEKAATVFHAGSTVSTPIYEVHDYLKIYYEIALSRFIDNVAIQVIERHLLGADGPLRVFGYQWVASMNTEKLDALVGESKEAKERRATLQANIDTLSDALQRAQKLSYVR